MTESDLAAHVVRWLEVDHFEVFHEVSIPYVTDRRADIVAKSEALWVVEAKRALSFELLEQAVYWRDYADGVWLAVPAPRRDPDAKSNRWRGSRAPGRSMARRIVKMLGLGLLEVKSLWPTEEQAGIRPVTVVHEPAWRHDYRPDLRDALREGHKTHAKAGSNRGGQYTRFKQTCENVRDYAISHPGCTLREALERVDHHYASVKSGVASLATWVTKGSVQNIELRIEKGATCVYALPTETG